MKRKKTRSGLITLDYVLVLGVVFPISVILYLLLQKGMTHLFYFTSITLGWMFF